MGRAWNEEPRLFGWATLPPTNMAPDRGSPEEEIDLPGTLSQVLC